MADISPRPGEPGPSGPRMQEPILDIEFSALSDPGRQRDHNEDYLGHVKPATTALGRSHGWFFALADGVGGHEQGEVASKAAIEDLLSGFQASPARRTA